MIVLPENYKKNMIKMFGSSINSWLDNAPLIIEKYIKKFNLVNLSFHNDLSINLLVLQRMKNLEKWY